MCICVALIVPICNNFPCHPPPPKNIPEALAKLWAVPGPLHKAPRSHTATWEDHAWG